jgi:hypothetical protein
MNNNGGFSIPHFLLKVFFMMYLFSLIHDWFDSCNRRSAQIIMNEKNVSFGT